MVKPLSAGQETWVRSLGWEDPLEKEMAAHSSTLAWKIPWMEEPGRLQSMGYIIHNSLPYFVSRILYLGCVLEIPREICKNTAAWTHLQKFGFNWSGLGPSVSC